MSKTLAARTVLTAGALAAAAALTPVSASAQTVFFSGWTNGCFNCSAPYPAFTPNVVQTWSTGNLMYVNSVFSGLTFMGYLGIGDDAVDQNGAAVLNVANFGAFYLDYSAAPINYAGQTFTLFINFVNPLAHQEVFTAAVSGAVQASTGGVFINFSNDPIWFGPQNQYSVRVNDVNLAAPPLDGRRQLAVSGDLTASAQAVPEPMATALLATGLMGLAVAGRRRRKLELD